MRIFRRRMAFAVLLAACVIGFMVAFYRGVASSDISGEEWLGLHGFERVDADFYALRSPMTQLNVIEGVNEGTADVTVGINPDETLESFYSTSDDDRNRRVEKASVGFGGETPLVGGRVTDADENGVPERAAVILWSGQDSDPIHIYHDMDMDGQFDRLVTRIRGELATIQISLDGEWVEVQMPTDEHGPNEYDLINEDGPPDRLEFVEGRWRVKESPG